MLTTTKRRRVEFFLGDLERLPAQVLELSGLELAGERGLRMRC
jgi:hypothetical protein